MASQKLNFWNYVIGWYIQKEQDKNVYLPIMSLFRQIGWET